MQPSREAARRNPLRDNSDKAQISCINFRVQREPDQLTEDEAHENRSQIQSLLMKDLQPPNKNKFMAEIFPKDDDKEYKGLCQRAVQSRKELSQDAKDMVVEQGNHEHDHRHSTAQAASQLRNSPTHIPNVDLLFLEQGKNFRNKEEHQLFLSIYSQQAHLFSKLESPEGKPLVAAKTANCATKRLSITKMQ